MKISKKLVRLHKELSRADNLYNSHDALAEHLRYTWEYSVEAVTKKSVVDALKYMIDIIIQAVTNEFTDNDEQRLNANPKRALSECLCYCLHKHLLLTQETIAKILDITRKDVDDYIIGYHTGISVGFEYQEEKERVDLLVTLYVERFLPGIVSVDKVMSILKEAPEPKVNGLMATIMGANTVIIDGEVYYAAADLEELEYYLEKV